MSGVEPGSAGESLFARVRAMLLRPSRAWAAVETETVSIRELYRGYVAPLAAIPAVCGLVGMLLFGYSIAGIGFQANLATALIEAVADYLMTLLAVFLTALAVSALAPSFGGVGDRGQALKLAAYSGTALWVAGVFALYPSLGLLVALLAGLYSLYTLFLGLPRLMRVPPENALTCFAAVLGAILVILVLKSVVVARAAELGGPLRTG
ncbi:Yip1 family protein [Phenylobacterium sp.]|uniref:Yip1 family protein n=1 Tax=Phenylobacterium sp. TaxID=1871053 RepID=UPI002FE165D9